MAQGRVSHLLTTSKAVSEWQRLLMSALSDWTPRVESQAHLHEHRSVHTVHKTNDQSKEMDLVSVEMHQASELKIPSDASSLK